MLRYLALTISLLISLSASADGVLPYSTRTRAYNGYSTTIRGDNETVGMANATVAIPGSISALETNPAGLTMTMGNVSAQVNSNEMRDPEITGSQSAGIHNNHWGLAVIPGNWGYALTYYTPSFEGGNYTSPNTGRESDYEVSLKQLRGSLSRAFFKKKLSIGATLELTRGVRNISSQEYGATDLTFKLGAIYHLKNHFLIGASYAPPQSIGDSLPISGSPELPGFAQPIRTPSILTLGTGWIPNRFFSLGLSVSAVGTTENTALFRDESRMVGQHFTLQPRFGASYVIAQYDFIKISTAAGTYYESSRTESSPNRVHGTFAFQVNPWFLNVGIGFDRAERYNNSIFSIGIDIVRAARTLKMIPKETVTAITGVWPNPMKVEADGLPDTLTSGEEKEYASPSVSDVGTIIREIPKNIENTLKGKPLDSEVREKNSRKKRKKK